MGRLDKDNLTAAGDQSRLTRAEYQDALDGLDKSAMMMRLVMLATDSMLDVDDQNAIVLGLTAANEHMAQARDGLRRALASESRHSLSLSSSKSDQTK